MLLSLALTLLAAPAGEDARSALARLTSDSGAERVDAERWLAANLSAADLPLVAEAAAAGAIEVRARLIHALGSDQRHFELGVLLTLDREPVVRRTGREALEALAAQWFGAAELVPKMDTALEDELRGRFLGQYTLRPAEHDLVELIDLLARAGPPVLGGTYEGGELAIAVDPLLYAEPPDATLRANATTEAEALLTGGFDMLLFRSLVGRAARLQGFGFEGPHPWLCVAHSPDAGQANGLELVLRWCRETVDYAERPRGAGAARALAACGWPAPLLWLEKRWVTLRDRNALAGLLLAASRGRVVGALCDEATVAQILAVADEPGSEWTHDIAAGLCRVPALGRDGADLSVPVLARWAEVGEPGRAMRAHIVAGMQRAPESWRAGLRAELERPDGTLEAATRLAYLKVLAATARESAVPWSPAPSQAMLTRVLRDRATPRFLAWVRRANAKPPAVWRELRGLAALTTAERALVLAWWANRDDGVETAARLAAEMLTAETSPVELGDALGARVRVGERARIAQVCAELAMLGDASSRAKIERVALFAGVLPDERKATLLGTLLDASARDAADWSAIGATLGGELDAGLVARAIELLGDEAKRAVKSAPAAVGPWADACERAVVGLRTRGATAECEKLLRALNSALRRGSEHPLWKPLREHTWPPYPGAEPIGLESSDPLWPR